MSFECLECPSALSGLGVPNFPLSDLQVEKVWNITRNGVVNSFVEFLKIFQNIYFYVTHIFLFLLGNVYKFSNILQARCNHSKGFQKLYLNIL